MLKVLAVCGIVLTISMTTILLELATQDTQFARAKHSGCTPLSFSGLLLLGAYSLFIQVFFNSQMVPYYVARSSLCIIQSLIFMTACWPPIIGQQFTSIKIMIMMRGIIIIITWVIWNCLHMMRTWKDFCKQ